MKSFALFRTVKKNSEIFLFASAFLLLAGGNTALADDAYTIGPAGTPAVLMEAVNGATVTLGSPANSAAQKWNLIPKGDKVYVIQPSSNPTLALTVQGGESANGTAVILEVDAGKPSQMWSFQKGANGTVRLYPQAAPKKALDDLGGNRAPGAKLDLWDFNADDPHGRWILTALDGAKKPDIVDDFPEGTVKPFTFDDSKIFPGTTRTGMVFIPAQYDGSKPACVYVQQDGYDPKSKLMLEKAIGSGDMPPVIGIFVRPGTLPAPPTAKGERRNRCFEYDGVGDNYVRFLNEELLPYVTKTFNVKLSENGNDRCIVGASSGGISAFNTAWERPDLFARVYACSGSFSAFREGQTFPTLIRKTEAKPIRAYFTTATHDMENCAGDWFLLDQEMDKALAFSGYDYSFKALEGHHCMGYFDEFPEAMRSIWKGYPAAVTAGKSAPRVRDIIVDGVTWAEAGKGYQHAVSPAVNSKGEVYFIDAPANKIYRIAQDGKIEVFADDAAHADGLAIGPKDEVYTVSASTGKVMSYDATAHSTEVAHDVPGRYVVARPDGGLYVTTAESKPEVSRIMLVKDGAAKQVDAGLKSATGMAYRPDQWLLAVADGGSKWVYSYEIGADGALKNKERFFPLQVSDWEDDAGAESVCYAQEGQLLVGTRSGVQACADDGPTQVILPLPDRSRVYGVALGGADKHTLYAFTGDKIWKRDVKIHGIGAFSPILPVKGTPL